MNDQLPVDDKKQMLRYARPNHGLTDAGATSRHYVHQLVLGERIRQNRKWGEQNHDPHLWNTILVEEIGEISKAILHNQFGDESFDHVAVELIQSIAVAYAMLECFERHGKINLRTLSLDS